jgi:hypothetical protein
VKGAERLRRLLLARRNVLAEIVQPLAQSGVGQGGDRGGIQLCDSASSGTPASSMVGMSGAGAQRVFANMANALTESLFR